MANKKPPISPFHTVAEEVIAQPSPSYELAFLDESFLLSEGNRPIRLLLEYLKTETLLREQNIQSTIVIFGSARMESQERAVEKLNHIEQKLLLAPESEELLRALKKAQKNLEKSYYYEEARRFGHIIAEKTEQNGNGNSEYVIVTGGGPGIMEAANRGAFEGAVRSIGLNILLPHEQGPNPYITPSLNFRFHYFAIRKMHFLMRASALVYFPGGYGTLDELFETLTLLQTEKISPVPIILFGRKYWNKIVNFDALIEEGAIDAADADCFQFAETAEEAWKIIADFYKLT